jgi:hypothetical protein
MTEAERLVAEAMDANPTRMSLFKKGFTDDYTSSVGRTYSRGQSEKNKLNESEHSQVLARMKS